MLKYLKDHILEELDGSVDYMKKAVELKGTNEGCVFRMMSEMEAQHAGNLTKIFNKTEKPKDVTDSEYSMMQKEILDAYTSNMSSLEILKKMYYMV